MKSAGIKESERSRTVDKENNRLPEPIDQGLIVETAENSDLFQFTANLICVAKFSVRFSVGQLITADEEPRVQNILLCQKFVNYVQL